MTMKLQFAHQDYQTRAVEAVVKVFDGQPLAKSDFALAAQQGRTLGEVVSALARKGLTPAAAPKTRNGIRLMPVRGDAKPTGLDVIHQLRDDLPWAP